jgi:hypothetical protein
VLTTGEANSRQFNPINRCTHIRDFPFPLICLPTSLPRNIEDADETVVTYNVALTVSSNER